MRDFEFVTDGYLSKDYLIQAIKNCGFEYEYDKEFNALTVIDKKSDSSFNVYLNETSSNGNIFYGEDQEGIEEDLKDKKFKHFTKLVWNFIDCASPSLDSVIKFVEEIKKDFQEIYFRGNDEIKFRRF